jgi:hypothetical protein
MRFLVLLYQDEQIWAAADEALIAQYYREHEAYSSRAADYGVTIEGSEALRSVRSATTLRRAGSDATVREGPFAETAEQLGGYYLVEAPSLEAVLTHARLLPEYTIEVREIAQV